jgi:hypothetical protein
MGYLSDFLCKVNSDDDNNKNNKLTYLYPEEALYLMENVSFFYYYFWKTIYFNNFSKLKTGLIIYHELNEYLIPMSIQQCYELFFKSA